MSRFLCLIVGFLFAAASFMINTGTAKAAVAIPQVSIEGLGNVLKIHGSHCGYRWGPKKRRAPYRHRHGNRCKRKHLFGHVTPGRTYYRGYGDPDAYRPRYHRRPVRRRCWHNSYGDLVCTGRH